MKITISGDVLLCHLVNNVVTFQGNLLNLSYVCVCVFLKTNNKIKKVIYVDEI